MSLSINTNINSLNAQRNLTSSSMSLSTAMERLSSGLRINSAKDDAAGLAISTRMTSQIRGLNQAVRNANDGVSLSQTAEGALQSSGDSLQRIRELAIQSANSTNSASDRQALNSEVNQLLAEVQRVGQTTQFNGQNLLDGSFTSAQFQVGANANQTIAFGIQGATTNLLGSYQAEGGAVTTTAFDGTNFTINGVQIGASAATTAAGVTDASATAKATAINAKTNETGVSATATNSLVGTSAPIAGVGLNSGELLINGIAVGSIAADANFVTQGQNAATAINLVQTQTGVTAVADAATGKLTLTAADGRDIKLTGGGAAGTARQTSIQDIANAIGLDANTGTDASGHATSSLTYTGTGGTVTTGSNTTNDIAIGDTVTIGSETFEFVEGSASATGSNVAVSVTGGTTTTADALTALATKLTAETTAGRNTINGSATGAVLTATSVEFGTSTFANPTVTTSGTTVAAVSGGTAAVDDAGKTTGGKITLSSASNFTLGGTSLADAGLASASTALSKLSSVDISTVDGANKAIAILDGSLSQITSIRSDLGAVQSRFESTVANLGITSQNLSSARSRIMDADFAAETAKLTKSQILQQAGIAMVSQANSQPKQVLALLR